MLPNPYRPRSAPTILSGRSRELSEIDQVISPALAGTQPAEGAAILYGVRGIGKTSILHEAAAEAESKGMVTAWVSVAKRQPFLPSLAQAIQVALKDFGITENKRWHLETLTGEINIGFAKATAGGKRDHDNANPPQWDVATVESLLSSAALSCANHGGGNGGGLLVIIDELHSAHESELSILANAFQNIAHGRRKKTPVALLAAGLPSVRGILTRAATFGERTQYIKVPALNENAARDAIAEPAQNMGVQVADDAIALLTKEANGYPFFLQLLGYHTWIAAEASSGNEILVSDAQAGIARAADQMTDIYAARWGAASPRERDLIVAMVRLGDGRPVQRRELADEMSCDIRDLSELRDRMINKAIIDGNTRGMLSFTLPGFAEYVATEYI